VGRSAPFSAGGVANLENDVPGTKEARTMVETLVRDRPTIPLRPPRPKRHTWGKYLSVTSFRRDGTGVATPVWFVETGGRFLVETDAGSFKVRRIRRNPHVAIAPCSPTGHPRGPAVTGFAQVLPACDVPRVEKLMARKYRRDLMVIRPIRWIQRHMSHRRDEHPIILSIRPA
jgi:PPOX class probable F420-dependent enzyme